MTNWKGVVVVIVWVQILQSLQPRHTLIVSRKKDVLIGFVRIHVEVCNYFYCLVILTGDDVKRELTLIVSRRKGVVVVVVGIHSLAGVAAVPTMSPCMTPPSPRYRRSLVTPSPVTEPVPPATTRTQQDQQQQQQPGSVER